MANRPEKAYRLGDVRVSVFRNSAGQGNGTFLSINPAKVYKDQHGKWQKSSQFDLRSAVLLRTLLDQAIAYAISQGEAEFAETPGGVVSSPASQHVSFGGDDGFDDVPTRPF